MAYSAGMIIWLALIVFVASTALVPVVANILVKKGILDQPIARSSHDIPTPRGAGLAIMPIIFIAWLFIVLTHEYMWPNIRVCLSVIICGVILCACTWIDDQKEGGLRVRTRLLIQLLAVSVPLIYWPHSFGRLFPEFMPVGVERVMMALAWVWFANLYNFMDGINGISAAEAISICGGLLVYCFLTTAKVPHGYELMVVVPMAAAMGFWVWNGRRVAKIFLGDVGSIGFGYCLAFLLFVFAARGYVMAAILVSLVYCMDASFTLIKRIWQKKQIWQAHREHYYHRATVKGALSHMQCVGLIVGVNILLTGLGTLVLERHIKSWPAFGIGAVLVISLLAYFYSLGMKHGHVSSPRPKAFRIERKARVAIKKARNKKTRRSAK